MKHLSLLAIGLIVGIAAGMPQYASAASMLYATDAETAKLYTVSTVNGSATLVGDLDSGQYMAGLAYDALNDILYGSTTLGNSLYSINRQTGHASRIGSLGVQLMHGLAFDSQTGTLYGSDGANKRLYRINTSTGNASLIGTIGYAITGMSFEPSTHLLYGCSWGTSNNWLVTIDPATGHATPVSPLKLNGISFNPDNGTLYGLSNGFDLPKGVYTIDIPSGSTTLVGLLPLSNPLDLQFVAVPELSSALLACVASAMSIGYFCCRRLRSYPSYFSELMATVAQLKPRTYHFNAAVHAERHT
jgi:hypothetical protein